MIAHSFDWYRGQFVRALAWLVGLLLVVGMAALLAFAPKLVAVLVGSILFLVLVLLLAPRHAVIALVVLTFVVIGPVETIGRVDRIFWASYVFAACLVAKALSMHVGDRLRSGLCGPPINKTDHGGSVGSPISWSVLAIVATACFSTLVSGPSVPQVLLATRDYLWMWGLFVLVVAGHVHLQDLNRVVRLLPWVVVLQAPLVLYQRHAVSSHAVRSWDAIVGVFGGNPDGGGSSGAMAAFSLLMALYVVLRVRAGLASVWFGLLVGACAAISIGLAEVKFVAMIAPLVALAVFGFGAIFRSPKVLLAFLAIVLASPLVLYGYWKSFETAGSKGYGSFGHYVQVIVDRNLRDSDISISSVEMGRVAALKFWWRATDLQTRPLQALVGNGIGATRIGMFPGEIAKRYSFKVARSSLAILLWEIGLMGSCLAIFSIVALLLRAWTTRLPADSAAPLGETACSLRLATGVMLVALLFLPYNTDLMGTPQFQLLFVLSCTLIWSARRAVHRGV